MSKSKNSNNNVEKNVTKNIRGFLYLMMMPEIVSKSYSLHMLKTTPVQYRTRRP